jgi:hypothetical protein
MLQQAAQSQISNITNKKSSVNKEIYIPDPPGFRASGNRAHLRGFRTTRHFAPHLTEHIYDYSDLQIRFPEFFRW